MNDFFLIVYNNIGLIVFLTLVLGFTILMLFFILRRDQETQRMKVAVDKETELRKIRYGLKD